MKTIRGYEVIKYLSETKLSKILLASKDKEMYVIKYSKYSNELILKEYKIIQSIKHKNIVKAIEMFMEDNIYYLVLEYIDGKNLDYKITVEELYTRLLSLVKVLRFINDNKILHLDLKPSNIIIGNELKLIDFGSAKYFDQTSVEISSTLDFAPIELIRNTELNIQTDIYMFGKLVKFLVIKSKIRNKDINDIIKISTYADKEDRFESWYEISKRLSLGYRKYVRKIITIITILLFSCCLFLSIIYYKFDIDVVKFISQVEKIEIQNLEGIYDLEEGYRKRLHNFDKAEIKYLRKLIAIKILASRLKDFDFLISLAKQYIDDKKISAKIDNNEILDLQVELLTKKYLSYANFKYFIWMNIDRYKLKDIKKIESYLDTKTYNELERDISSE